MAKRPRSQPLPGSIPTPSFTYGDVQELRDLVVTINKVITDAREVVTAGRLLQRDLRQDIASYKRMIHDDVETTYEKRVNEAVQEMMRVLNDAQRSAVKQVFYEFDKVRSALFNQRTPEEIAIIAQAIGNSLAVRDARMRFVPDAKLQLIENGVPLLQSTTVLQEIEADHLLFHRHND